MRSPLDNQTFIRQHDQSDVYRSLTGFAVQFESGWHDAQFINLGFESDRISNIVFVGMGGSSLSAHLTQSLAPFLLKHPFTLVSNYRLPQYTNKHTLVIACSYSGDTEEVLSCAQDALHRSALFVGLTTGGKLQKFCLDNHLPAIILDGKQNPSRVPRFGLGLLLGASLGLIMRLNQEAYSFFDRKEIVRIIERGLDSFAQTRPATENQAKLLAGQNKGQAIVIFSANHLDGVAKTAVNFINESAKTFAVNFQIPDLNHHLLDGLLFPPQLKDHCRFILLDSILYPDIVQKRLSLTKDILLKQKYQLTTIKPESSDAIGQTLESLVFFLFFSYYLSIANKQDPGTNHWVDYLKKQIS